MSVLECDKIVDESESEIDIKDTLKNDRYCLYTKENFNFLRKMFAPRNVRTKWS